MADDSKKKRRYKKNKGEENMIYPETTIAKPQPVNQVYSTTSKTLVEDAKQYLNLDLNSMSSATQLKYKLYLDFLTKAIELKKAQAPSEQMYNLLLSVNEKKQDYLSVKVKNKYALMPIAKDVETAKEFFDAKYKKLQDKDKFHKKLVDKGNQMNREKVEISQKADEKRKQIIQEAEDYVKELQKKQQDETEEREKLIAENMRMKKEIERCLLEGLNMKGQFDKEMMESQERIQRLEGKNGKGGIQKTMDELSKNAQKSVLENTQLKTEIMTLQQKNAEMEKLSTMFDEQFEKISKEMEEKKTETIFTASENVEIKERVKTGKMDKVEMAALLKEYETETANIKTMNSLHQKYTKQLEALKNELFPPEEKHEEHDCCCGHEHEKEEECHNDESKNEERINENESESKEKKTEENKITDEDKE